MCFIKPPAGEHTTAQPLRRDYARFVSLVPRKLLFEAWLRCGVQLNCGNRSTQARFGPQTSAPCDLCHGDFGAADRRLSDSCPDCGSLLARHSLERALTVA